MSLARCLISIPIFFWLGSAFANPVTSGPNTILLDNFNGSTVGTAVGPLQFEPVQNGFGQAARFGPGNFIRYPVTLPWGSEGTIELWIKPDMVPAVEQPGILEINWGNQDSYPPAGHILHLGLWGGPEGEVQISAWPGGYANGTTPLTTSGQWMHIAGSWGPQGTKVYINGRLDGSSPSSMTVGFSGTNYLYLNYYGDLRFAGLVDDLHMSNVQLPDAVIADHAAVPPGLDVFVFPDKGGVDGAVTLRLQGPNFPSDLDSIALVAPGEPDITGYDIIPTHSDTYHATFDLSDVALGKRDAVLSFDDGSVLTIADAFEVINSSGPVLTLDILGPFGPRLGREATYLAVVRNIGFNDSYPSSVTISLDEPGSLSIADALAVATSNVLVSTVLLNTSFGKIAPSGTGVFPFLNTPLSADCRNLTGEVKDPCAAERQRVADLVKQILPVQAQIGVLKAEFDALDCAGARGGPDPANERRCLQLAKDLNALESRLQQLRDQLDAAFDALSKCLAAKHASGVSISNVSNVPSGVSVTGSASVQTATTSSFSFCPITSWDPNDKVGIEGVEPEGYVSSSLPFLYTIHFENLATASASAQDVVVVDQLDTDLDWTTFELGGIQFGDHFVEVPPESQSFSTTVDLRPDLDIVVEIDANLDPNTGLITWQFRSTDPDTGGFPEDPSAGFLPPNIVPPGGEGSVSFTVRAKATAETGTEIRNQATIVFDVNPPIDTNQWLNTVDNTAPQSDVLPLSSIQKSAIFPVTWKGTDEESGVREYTIYVSDNDGPATVLLNNTSDTSLAFTGQPGHSYAFYSVAMDHAGNVEEIPEVPDVATHVSVPGDLNEDDLVNCADLAIVRASFSKKTGQPGFDTRADVTGDGIVDVRDLSFVARRLPAGTKCN